MEMSAAERCREGAAGEVLARIRGDSRRVTGRVRTILAFIERWLFEEELSLAGIRKGCGIKDTGFGEWFRAEVGVSPGRYVRERRLEVAAGMLVGSRLEVGLICQLVGFTLPQTFTKAFRRWAGMSPSEYRGRYGTVGVVAPVGVGREVWERGVWGRLQARQAEALARRLWERYWQDRGERSPPPVFVAVEVSGEEVEEVKAGATWEVLRELSAAEQGEVVRGGLGFTTPALYERLHRASREVGREDRAAGVALARLAVECVESLVPHVEAEEVRRLRAHGWGWVGNACRNALDFGAAERAFEIAGEHLAGLGECPEVRADLLDLLSGLRLFQRRYDEALELVSRAVAVLRGQQGCDGELLTRILLRRVDVQRFLGRYGDALTDIREVMGLVEEGLTPELELIACQHLGVLLVKLGLLAEAAEVLPRARKLAAELENRTFDAYLCWSEALLRQGEGRMKEAEAQFVEAREGFRQAREEFHVACVALDLAMLCLAQHRAPDAMALAQETLPVFELLAAHPEALRAIRLLRQAVRHEELTQALLSEVRACLERAWDPHLLQAGMDASW